MPRFELRSKRFCDWTDADWHEPENLCALWDRTGQVFSARGPHYIHEMPNIGRPAPEFLDANRT